MTYRREDCLSGRVSFICQRISLSQMMQNPPLSNKAPLVLRSAICAGALMSLISNKARSSPVVVC